MGVGAAPARTCRGGVQLVFGDDRKAVEQEAAGERADAEHEGFVAVEKRGEILALGRR